jgi:hypothetical protein
MTTGSVEIHGACDERFSAIRDACAENFQKCGEVGAAGAVTVDGKPVVDRSFLPTEVAAWHRGS